MCYHSRGFTENSKIGSMKIKFIEPSAYLENNKIFKTEKAIIPSLTLPYLAALTPADIDISIVNDQLEDINFDEKVDLVGITSYTPQILRAYEIADEFKKRGVPIVMGGMHVSMEPEEAMGHANTVIVGEAEETWPEFIEDFRRGVGKKLYAAKRKPSLRHLRVPRFSLLNKDKYISSGDTWLNRFLPLPMLPIQTARGCPHSCDFCSVSVFYGATYRPRPVDEVVNEIVTIGSKGWYFVDDNIFANPARAKELFRKLIPLKITWIGSANINASEDKELMRLARKSGCICIMVGLESLDNRNIKSVGKSMNKINLYEENIKAYHKEGITLILSMIFGFDDERPIAIKEAYNFLTKNRVSCAFWWPLTPLPGTPLMNRLRQACRLKDDKWWLNPELAKKGNFLKFNAKGLPEERAFKNNINYYYSRFTSLKDVFRRCLFLPPQCFLLSIYLNLILRKNFTPYSNI